MQIKRNQRTAYSGTNQYTHTKSKSVAALSKSIDKTLAHQEYTPGVFIDIDGAFSNVLHKIVMKALGAHLVNLC